MTSPENDHEEPVDLSALAPELDRRASRTVDQLAARIASAGVSGATRLQPAGSGASGSYTAEPHAPEPSLAEAVRRRLARAALPALVAAAAACAAVLLSGKGRAGGDDAFVGLLLGGEGPLVGWVAENRRPDPAELLPMLEGAR